MVDLKNAKSSEISAVVEACINVVRVRKAPSAIFAYFATLAAAWWQPREFFMHTKVTVAVAPYKNQSYMTILASGVCG